MDEKEARYRQQDEAGDAEGAMMLGSVLRGRGDNDGALEAFARGDERGHRDGPGMVGLILEERGALDDAVAVYQRGLARDSDLAAFNLGLLLVTRGDEDGAREAWQIGDRLGDAECSGNLGSLLMGRGELAEAEAALRRAHEGGSTHGTRRLGECLEDQDRLDEAHLILQGGAERDDPDAAFALARVLLKKDEAHAALTVLEQAQELGHPSAAEMVDKLRAELQPRESVTIGEMLERQKKLAAEDPVGKMTYLEGRYLYEEVPDLCDRTEAELRAEAESSGDTASLVRLGLFLERARDLDGAAGAFREAAARGDAYAEFRLGFMVELHQRDRELAMEHYRRADEAGERNAAGNLGRLLEERGDLLEAEQAFGRCFDRGGIRALANHAGLMMDREGATHEELRSTVVKLCEVEDLFVAAQMRDRRGGGGNDHVASVSGETAPPLMVMSGYWERVDASVIRAGVVAADAGGSASGAFHLGVVLQKGGDLREAAKVSARAAERGYVAGWTNAAACHLQTNDPQAAETAARRGEAEGEIDSIFLLALARDAQGDLAGSLEANRRADALGHADAALNLGIDLSKMGRYDEAEQALLRAQERGAERAAEQLHNLRPSRT